VKLTSCERYEIEAFAFRRITGHMAPGKDVAPAAYEAPYEERAAEWAKWREAYEPVVSAMLHGVERILYTGDDE
jgi:hypothetical protein